MPDDPMECVGHECGIVSCCLSFDSDPHGILYTGSTDGALLQWNLKDPITLIERMVNAESSQVPTK